MMKSNFINYFSDYIGELGTLLIYSLDDDHDGDTDRVSILLNLFLFDVLSSIRLVATSEFNLCLFVI
jgi:hypothetical protein